MNKLLSIIANMYTSDSAGACRELQEAYVGKTGAVLRRPHPNEYRGLASYTAIRTKYAFEGEEL